MGFENFCSVDVDLFAVEKSLDVGQVHVDGIVGWEFLLRGGTGVGRRHWGFVGGTWGWVMAAKKWSHDPERKNMWVDPLTPGDQGGQIRSFRK